MRPQSISEILSPERDAVAAFNRSENERLCHHYRRIRRGIWTVFFVLLGAVFWAILAVAFAP
jgi:hypothetical protein